ncbi:MAG: hypothetical protein IPM11_08575 [Micropruina sp.]|nr:hypothetical protein [Micropruina sp.]
MSTITLALTSTSVTATGSPVSVTASVTNSATVPARIVLGVFPVPDATGADARPWTQIDQPLREIAPGTTEQFTITLTAPAGTAAGQYNVRFIAYDADRPPEEYSDQAQQLQVVVAGAKAAATPARVAWWIYAIAGVLVVVVGVVAFLVLRPSPPVVMPSESPSATPTPSATLGRPPLNPCPAPYVPRLARPSDLTCVTVLSAAEAKADNDPQLQKARKDPAGPYGPESCIAGYGYVWREAYSGDTTCVPGSTRTRSYWENQGHPLGKP